MKARIENNAYPNEPNIGIEEMSITYVQNPNTDDETGHYQRLRISTVNVPSCEEDGEEPPYYYNFVILPFDDGKPGHWSFDNSEELVMLFNDFLERLKYKHEEK